MTLTIEENIWALLKRITVPDSGKDIVSLGMVSGLSLLKREAGLHVAFSLEINPQQKELMEPVRQAAEQALCQLPNITSAAVVMTAHKGAPPARPSPHREKWVIPGVRHIVAIASGKGGVGKSTTALNLAIAMVQNGLKVGILDADIYGPSLPRMLQLNGKPDINKDKKMIPPERFGLAVMSMGFLVAEDAPIIWRGPMVHSAITQLFRDVDWGARDILIVDMPPGTGDAHLTMALQVPLSGSIIISTPQDIALLDARKGLNMFKKVDVPILGIIENMSYFICPHCQERSDIFSHGGARQEAASLGVPFLGEIPLDIAIRQTSDEGVPIVQANIEGKIAVLYRHIADKIWGGLNP